MSDWENRFESLIDRKIREAAARGAFDDLPGAGKPLPDAGEPYREDWWLRQLARRENLGPHALPTPLRLRREAQDLAAGLGPFRGERDVREAVADYNERVRQARRTPHSGPAVVLRELDADEAVAAWRDHRAGPNGATPS